MSKNWILTIRTIMRDGTEKISRPPMIAESDISEGEALKIAVDIFGAERVISVAQKYTKKS